jgi:hypothetical protein
MRIDRDTSTLLNNIRDPDPEIQRKERAAIERLAERCSMFGSHIVRYEPTNTKKETRRNELIIDYQELERVPNDEKLLGYNTVTDQYGGFCCSPLISDVQDEALRDELVKHGLGQRDAEHITQAVCNDCDVFLTLDMKTIINPHGHWLKKRFPKLHVLRPSQLLEVLDRENDAAPG